MRRHIGSYYRSGVAGLGESFYWPGWGEGTFPVHTSTGLETPVPTSEPPIQTSWGQASGLTPIDLARLIVAGGSNSLTAIQHADWVSLPQALRDQMLELASQQAGAATPPAIPAGSPTAAQQAAGTPTNAGFDIEAWFNKSTSLFGTAVKNSYLVAGAGVAILALLLGKKGKR